MMIVDAMDFFLDHVAGCHIVLITSDMDFSYLLSRLQNRATVETTLVTTGAIRLVLGLAATRTMRWETDILQLAQGHPPLPIAPPRAVHARPAQLPWQPRHGASPPPPPPPLVDSQAIDRKSTAAGKTSPLGAGMYAASRNRTRLIDWSSK